MFETDRLRVRLSVILLCSRSCRLCVYLSLTNLCKQHISQTNLWILQNWARWYQCRSNDNDEAKWQWQSSNDAPESDPVMTSTGEITSVPVSRPRDQASSRGQRRARRRRCHRSTSTGRRPVHLWQFLRDLLQLPQRYHAGVRWIDRDTGQTFSCILLSMHYS